MNYLAHAYLSYDNPELLVGNMLGDFVKGNKYKNFAPPIAAGMQYHRLIDEFTDKHPSVRAATKIIREDGIRYAGVFIDIFFDHFLANDKSIFATNEELQTFTNGVLATLQQHEHIMTPDMKIYFGYMIRYNWLYHYHSLNGIEKSILGIIKRYPRLGNGDEILFSLFNNIENLRPHYLEFFADVQGWSKRYLGNSI